MKLRLRKVRAKANPTLNKSANPNKAASEIQKKYGR